MCKRMNTNKTLQFTARVHRQHTSLVITVPKGLCNQLEIVKGDILLFELELGDVAAVVGKMALRGVDNERDKGDSVRGDSGGRT